jgi:hypothetical protein
MILYLLFMLVVAVLIWGIPALVFFFLLDFPLLQSLLFGFLAGSLLLGLSEAFGLISRVLRKLRTRDERTRKDVAYRADP